MLPIQKYVKARMMRQAEERGKAWELTDDDFRRLTDAPCTYCGATHTNVAHRNQFAVKEWSYNGIDRVNSDQGYAIGNVVTCCAACNRAKSDLPHADFVSGEWLKSRIATVKKN